MTETNSTVVKKNILYNTIGNFVYLACQWLITVLVVRLSNYNDAGILSLAMSISSTLYSVSTFGMRGYQSSDLKNKFSHSDYFNSRIYTSILSIIFCFIFLLINTYNNYTKLCIFVYLLFKLNEAITDVLHGEEQKYWRMDVIGISFFLRGIISIIVFSLSLYFSKSLLLSITLMAISVFLIIVFYDFKKYKEIVGKVLKPNNKQIITLLIICLPLAIYGFLGNGIQFYPKYILEKTYSSEILGIYSSIAAPVLIIQTAAMFVFNPLTTLFAEYYINKDSKNFYKLFLKVSLIVLVIGIVGYIGVIIFGNFGLNLLFGNSILEYSYLLKQIVITTTLTAFVWFTCLLLIVIRNSKILLSSSTTAFLFSIILSHILIKKYSMSGVTLVLIITLLIQIILSIIFGYKYLKRYFNNEERSLDNNMISKIKNKMLKFAINHRDFILKYTPNKVLTFFEKIVVKGGINDFKRVTEFDKNLESGINFIGYLKAQFGLGQGSRLICRAIKESKIKLSAIDTNIGPGKKYGDTEFDDILSKEFPYNINLTHCLPHTSFEIMISQIGLENLKGRYNIGYWVFELEDIPEKWHDSFKYVNEIWTPSNFVTAAFKKVSPVPVYTIPYGIETIKNEKLTRKDFNIPEKKFTFLTMFDSGSSSERKNPIDAINAFVEAFPNNDDVCLVVKISNSLPEDIEMLKEKLKNVKHYVFIDEILPKEDVYSLISLCDVFVSLHRSEGFGLVMAEAMSLGTVCIATNYSANTDFMNKDNSCLVDYKMVPVNVKHHLYTPGNKWAQADVKQASKYMKQLYKDKKLYDKLKKNAKKYIQEEFSIKKCTERIEKRFNEIKKENNL